MRSTAIQASDTARSILAQFKNDSDRIAGLGRQAGSAQQVHQLLQRKPINSIPVAARSLKVSAPTARAAVNALQKIKIVKEITGKQRDRIYVYEQYMNILESGTEPL